MKREMALVRRIALAVEALPAGEILTSDDLADVDVSEFALHVAWMDEAGLIRASINDNMDGEPAACFVLRLTWAGCEFTDAVRNETLWRRALQEVMANSKSFTFEFLRDWLKTEIAQGFPSVRQGQ